MRKPVITGVFLVAAVLTTSTSKAQALEPSKLLASEKPNITNAQTIDEPINKTIKETIFKTISAEETAEPKEILETKHKVVEGETLSKIASKYNTNWDRIFFKNTQIANPDVIKPNDELIIPRPDEQLASRPIPVALPAAPAQQPRTNSARPAAPRQKAAKPQTSQQSKPVARGSSAGNTYTYGYCTWYVKNRRPDLPNNLGNAETWVARAAAQGLPTGNTPRVGAVGQAGMHVVYVESVNGDGTITISEMNRAGWNVQSSRTVAANAFRYIY